MEALINNLKIEGVNYTLSHSTSIGKALFCAVIISIACVLAIIVVVKVTKILDKKRNSGHSRCFNPCRLFCDGNAACHIHRY